MSLEKVIQVIEDVGGIGTLATCVDGQPRVRPMSVVVRPGCVLWSSTYRESGKIRELEQNSRVELCFVDSKFVQVRIEGVLDLTGGEDSKRTLLEVNPKVRNHFPDEHDPKMVHLEIVPTLIRWKPAGFSEYNVVTL